MPAFKLNEEDIEITHTKGSGPGGQNRNKRMSGIRLKHLPTGIVVMATERRSQEQNLHAAFERLEERLERHFYIKPKRVKTKKTRSSQARRVENKKHRASHKQLRRRVSFDEG
jgi:protein subunit release factor A